MAKPIVQRITLTGAAEVESSFVAIGRAAKTAYDTIRTAAQSATDPANKLSESLEKVKESLANVSTEAENTQKTLVSTFSRSTKVLAAAGVTIAGLVGFVGKLVTETGEAVDEAEKLGITFGAYRKYQGLAAALGVEFSTFKQLFETANKGIEEAANRGNIALTGYLQIDQGRIVRTQNAIDALQLSVGDFTRNMAGVASGVVLVTDKNVAQLRRLKLATDPILKTLGDFEKALFLTGVKLADPETGQAKSNIKLLDDLFAALSKADGQTRKAAAGLLVAKGGVDDLLKIIEAGPDKINAFYEALGQRGVGGAATDALADTVKKSREIINALKSLYQSGLQRVKDTITAFFSEPLIKIKEAIFGEGDLGGADVGKALESLAGRIKRAGGVLFDEFGKLFAPVFKDINATLQTGLDGFDGIVVGFLRNILTLTRSALVALNLIPSQVASGLADASGQRNRVLENITALRDRVVELGSAAKVAFTDILGPALVGIKKAADFVAEAFNGIFGANLTGGAVIIGGILLKISGILGLLSGLIGTVSAAFSGLGIIIVGAVLTAFSRFGTTATEVYESIKKSFGGVPDVVNKALNKTEDRLDKYRAKAEDIRKFSAVLASSATAEAVTKEPVAGGQSQVPTLTQKDVQPWKELRDVVIEIADALKNAFDNVKLLLTDANGEAKTFNKILDGIVFAVNKVFGTNFTKGGLAVVGIFLALSGLLAPLVIVLAGFSTIILNVATGLGKLVVGGAKFLVFLGRVLIGAGGAGTAFAKFGTIATGAIRGIMVAIRGLLGWPGLLIAGIGLVYTYWDDIVEYASKAWDTLKGVLGQLWSGFKTLAKDAWDGVTTIARDAWDAIATIGTETWSAITTVGSDSWAAITTVATDFWSAVREVGTSTWNGIKTVATDVWSGTIGTVASYWRAVEQFGSDAWATVKAAWSTLSNVIRNAFGIQGADAAKVEAELVDPFKRAVESIRQAIAVELPTMLEDALSSVVSVVSSFADDVERQVARIIEAVQRAKAERDSLGSGGSSDGSAFASGGYVRGPGSGTSDSIPAWLSNGEFVIRAAAVKQYGVAFLRAINGLRVGPASFKMGMPKFAMGGLVDSAIGRNLQPALAGGLGGGSTLNLTIGGQTFAGLYAPEHTASQLQRFAEQSSVRSSGRKPGWRR